MFRILIFFHGRVLWIMHLNFIITLRTCGFWIIHLLLLKELPLRRYSLVLIHFLNHFFNEAHFNIPIIFGSLFISKIYSFHHFFRYQNWLTDNFQFAISWVLIVSVLLIYESEYNVFWFLSWCLFRLIKKLIRRQVQGFSVG